MWTETSWEKWQKKERKEQFCLHNPSCFQELFLCVYCISAFMLGNMYILCFSLILLYIGYLEFVMVPIPSPLVCNLGYIQLSGRATRAVLLFWYTQYIKHMVKYMSLELYPSLCQSVMHWWCVSGCWLTPALCCQGWHRGNSRFGFDRLESRGLLWQHSQLLMSKRLCADGCVYPPCLVSVFFFFFFHIKQTLHLAISQNKLKEDFKHGSGGSNVLSILQYWNHRFKQHYASRQLENCFHHNRTLTHFMLMNNRFSLPR